MQTIKTHSKLTMIQRSKLKPFGNNSRTHTKAQVIEIAKSIEIFGFTNPILITEDNTIVAGHGRFMAAEILGLVKVPCLLLSGLSENEVRAYVIADNKLAEKAGWDKELLRLELGSLKREDFGLDVIGFSEKELEKLMADPKDLGGPGLPAKKPDEVAVIVTCGDEEEQQRAYDLLSKNGFSCRTASLNSIMKA